MKIVYCATFIVNGTPVSLADYIMVHGPRDFPVAAACLVAATLEHPYYQKILGDSANSLHLRSITGYCFETKKTLTTDAEIALTHHFCEEFRKHRKPKKVIQKESIP